MNQTKVLFTGEQRVEQCEGPSSHQIEKQGGELTEQTSIIGNSIYTEIYLDMSSLSILT